MKLCVRTDPQGAACPLPARWKPSLRLFTLPMEGGRPLFDVPLPIAVCDGHKSAVEDERHDFLTDGLKRQIETRCSNDGLPWPNWARVKVVFDRIPREVEN